MKYGWLHFVVEIFKYIIPNRSIEYNVNIAFKRI